MRSESPGSSSQISASSSRSCGSSEIGVSPTNAVRPAQISASVMNAAMAPAKPISCLRNIRLPSRAVTLAYHLLQDIAQNDRAIGRVRVQPGIGTAEQPGCVLGKFRFGCEAFDVQCLVLLPEESDGERLRKVNERGIEQFVIILS